MQPPPPLTYSAVAFCTNTRQDDDGRPGRLGEMRLVSGTMTATGLGESVLQTARGRLRDDATVLRFYGTWSNGYVFGKPLEN